MREATARERGRRQARAIEEGPETGLFGRLADRVLANPVLSGGVLVAILASAVIAGNALLLQSGRHPAPFFVTRPDGGGEASTLPVPRDRIELVRPVPVQSETIPLPVDDGEIDPIEDAAIILGLQKELAARGLFDDEADGIFGARTRQAIAAYQRGAGLEVTGEPSEQLLTHIRNAPEGAERTEAAPTLAERQRLTAVQEALNDIGYGPLRVDGRTGGQTADAIRRFELDNGMPITGEVGGELIDKLVAIGAMQPI